MRRGGRAVSVGGKRPHLEIGFAAGNAVQGRAGKNGARQLRHDIRYKICAVKTPAGPESKRDGRVEMAAGNVPHRVGHSQHRKAESQGDAKKADARAGRHVGRQHRAAAAAEYQPERAENFRKILFHSNSFRGVVVCRKCRKIACLMMHLPAVVSKFSPLVK